MLGGEALIPLTVTLYLIQNPSMGDGWSYPVQLRQGLNIPTSCRLQCQTTFYLFLEDLAGSHCRHSSYIAPLFLLREIVWEQVVMYMISLLHYISDVQRYQYL
jgi:hypothetical protein